MPNFVRVSEFDTWRPGYAGAVIEILIAGTDTLADVFTNTALTSEAANPQTLLTQTEDDNTTSGKFAVPLYVGQAYQLRNATGETTGVVGVPITTLEEQVASLAVATTTRGSASRTLAAHLDNEVWTANYGTFASSASANQAILDAAIGAASAQGGGRVRLPAGNWAFTAFTLPQNVVLQGHARGATTLRSEQTSAVCTIGGDGAGLMDLTLDGVNLNSGSIGILAVGRDRVFLDNVIVKRFASGIVMRGGEDARFREAYVQNCATGADIRGDRDAMLSNTGGPALDLLWDGGSVETCTTLGLRFSFEDDPVQRMTVRGVAFLSNTGPAVTVNGARDVLLDACLWTGNTVNIAVTDDNDLSRVDENTVQQVTVRRGSLTSGQNTFNGLCEDVRFEGCNLSDIDWILSVPTNPILLLDCTEDTLSTSTGATGRLMRRSSFHRGEFPGVTTDASYTTAWSQDLEPGEVIRVRARVLGRQRNGEHRASGELIATFYRPGSVLSFGSASATPVVGTVVVGDTSGAQGRVVAMTGTSSGTLTLRDIAGDFVNGEGLTFSDAKTASATSTLAPVNATLRDTTILEYASAGVTPVVGTTMYGATSASSARVVGVAGTTVGTLTLRSVEGYFITGESLIFSDANTAVATDSMVPADYAYSGLQRKTNIAFDWRAAVTGTSALVQVKGDTGQIIEWLIDIDMVRP